MITIMFNGKAVTTTASNVQALLAEKGIDASRSGIALARNAAIVPRAHWNATPLAEGDSIDVVHAIAGG